MGHRCGEAISLLPSAVGGGCCRNGVRFLGLIADSCFALPTMIVVMSINRLAVLRERIGEFPKSPGVYLMKDAHGVVLYVGKAKDLRSRVSSYFQPGADLLNTRGPDICRMVDAVVDVDYVECETEVDALLMESRLIKDIQPPHNAMLKDGKTFPYIEITTSDDFPGVYITRTPRPKGSKLYGPFLSVTGIRDAVNAMQKVFRFRTCRLEIQEEDERRRFFRPCLLHSIKQCTAPCAALVSREDYRQDIDRLRKFLGSKRSVVLRADDKGDGAGVRGVAVRGCGRASRSDQGDRVARPIW